MRTLEDRGQKAGPGELATMVARLANASARTVRASVVVRKERGKDS